MGRSRWRRWRERWEDEREGEYAETDSGKMSGLGMLRGRKSDEDTKYISYDFRS